MKIVQPSVELLHSTPNPERVIERCGRACYQSQHKVAQCAQCNGTGSYHDPKDESDCPYGCCNLCQACNGTGTDISSAIAIAFIKRIIANGHEAVLEHASAGFSIITDRGVTHEIVRHRLASYAQESTRYCNYSKDAFGNEITVIEPPGLRTSSQVGIDPRMADGDLAAWAGVMEGSEHIYLEMLARGVEPQIARSVLPNSLKSEICMTANFREWRHFLRLRTSPKAHPQMREIAEMIRAELLKLAPVCFEDLP